MSWDKMLPILANAIWNKNLEYIHHTVKTAFKMSGIYFSNIFSCVTFFLVTYDVKFEQRELGSHTQKCYIIILCSKIPGILWREELPKITSNLVMGQQSGRWN